MKKITSILSCGALLLSCSAIQTYADEPVPIQLEDAVYQQLLKHSCDKNKDGIITEEEFRSATFFSLDLDDVQSLDFLNNADSLNCLYLKGGSFSDFSVLKNLSRLEELELSNMPQVTDISFIKDMNLIYCYLYDLENITDEQKFEVVRFCEDDMQVGCSKIVGMLPVGMFDNSYNDFTIEISDPSMIDLGYDNYSSAHDSAAVMYAAKPGRAEYTIKYKDEIIHKKTINIEETEPIKLSENSGVNVSQIYGARYSNDGNVYVISDDNLCSLENGRLNVVKEGVKARSADFIDFDGKFTGQSEITLFTDGHIEVNDTAISNAENIFFTAIEERFCASNDNRLYVLKEANGDIIAEFVCEGFGSFIEDESNYFVSNTGELIYLEYDLKSGKRTPYPTGIMNYISCQYDYFIDENKVLFKYIRGSQSAEKIASDVEYVGYRYYSDGKEYSCVYITSDGTAYTANKQEKVELVSDRTDSHLYRNSGIFNDELYGAGGMGFNISDYHISHDNIFYINSNGVFSSVCDVDKYIRSEYVDGELRNVYFRKTDGTAWYYSFADNKYHAVNESELPATVKGDVNGDGSFNTADLVLLQKYLLGSETQLAIPENGDLCEDNVLDVFDLVCMRRLLVYVNEN